MVLPVGGSECVCVYMEVGVERRGGDRRQREIRAREADAGQGGRKRQ